MNPLSSDLDSVIEHASRSFKELRGERIFITGGTGFVGSWLLESLLWANDRLSLGTRVVVLTRDPERFGKALPHVAAHEAVETLRGDLESFRFPEGTFSHIIHAAAPVSLQLEQNPQLVFDAIVNGTRRVLEFAHGCRSRRFLLTSSGAIYGPQPDGVERIDELLGRAPDCTDPRATYAEAKRAAELLCVLATKAGGPEAKIARCFCFGGPYLPLDASYAFGNFIRDALAGAVIRVRGDGTALRSYLYAGDLAVWLWTILVHGKSGRAYNVGSEEGITVAELARRMGAYGEKGCRVLVEGQPSEGRGGGRYVPCTKRAQSELGLGATVGLETMIRKTFDWHSAVRRNGR